MNRENLEQLLRLAVEEYIADEETYDDNAQLLLNPKTFELKIVNLEEASEEGADSDEIDAYDVMDFVKMSPDDSGKWIVDEESISSVASEYVG